ncbi:hypothetical protein BR93DRAFT_943482 [Coniochaeta sp. PMI_546]|nr:hypothetical protein BR93DRAFT_943482 [Coniochaeta sp. PMI_546]
MTALTKILLLAGCAAAQTRVQSQWGQCAGSSYAGPTACPKNFYCSFGNPWYSQCLPGTADDPLPGGGDSPLETSTLQTIVTVNGPQPTVVTTYITYLTPPPSQGPATVTVINGQTYTLIPDEPYTPEAQMPASKRAVEAQAQAQAAIPQTAQAPSPTTLVKGQYWIRAVASPNFHKYLQTKPANEPGVAILGSSKTAGQFSVVSGQLVEYTGAGTPPLYLNVEKPADFTQRALKTWFNTTQNAFGTFVFQGDALTWSAAEVKRQNLAAWLVCKDQALFINTGAYAYQTPAGCADQTIHYYNDATAND